MSLPINSCVEQISQLPIDKGGLGIHSLKFLSEKQCLSTRAGLQNNLDPETQSLWDETTHKNILCDSLLLSKSYLEAKHSLTQSYTERALEHTSNLTVQGGAFSSINSELNSREIGRWARLTTSLPDFSLKNFRKAIQQQLATAANKVKWGRATSNLCSLCNQI